MRKLLLVMLILLATQSQAFAEQWRITAYCACAKCCGRWADGRTASNKAVKYGYVANNWLPFGTKVSIEGIGDFVVEDRGAKRYFGSKTNHKKALDIYMPSHSEARKFGVKYRKVVIK